MMELDVFVPDFNLAFEYQGFFKLKVKVQGEQHYSPIYHMSTDHLQLVQRDEEKRNACENANITLIEVPYWWDFSKSSLAATILKKRPDIPIYQVEVGNPIPDRPDQDIINFSVPISQAEDWNGKKDLTGWFVILSS